MVMAGVGADVRLRMLKMTSMKKVQKALLQRRNRINI